MKARRKVLGRSAHRYFEDFVLSPCGGPALRQTGRPPTSDPRGRNKITNAGTRQRDATNRSGARSESRTLVREDQSPKGGNRAAGSIHASRPWNEAQGFARIIKTNYFEIRIFIVILFNDSESLWQI